MESRLSYVQWNASTTVGHTPVCEGRVVGASVAQRQRLLDALGATGWPMRWSHRASGIPAAADLAAMDDPVFAVVRPGADVRVAFYFAGDCDDIDFDVELDDIVDQATLDAFVAVVREVGAATTSDVVLTYEDEPNAVLGAYDAASDAVTLGAVGAGGTATARPGGEVTATR